MSEREPGRTGKWWPLVAVCLGNFMLLIDVTIVVTALPRMAEDLDAGLTDLQWVMDAYALALAALLMAAGAAGDLFGRRRVYVLGLAAFALSSLACALAPGAEALIAARVVQGLAAAAMFATNAPLLAAAYAGRDRGVAFGVWGAVSGAASALGVLLGGVLTEYLAWPAIFLVNLPVSALTIALTWRFVAESRDTARAGVRVDWPGTVAFTLTAGALTYGLIRGGEESWTDGLTLLSFAVAALALLAFVRVEARTAHPLLDLRLMRQPSFAALMVAGMVLTAAAFAHYAFTMLWLQDTQGLSPVRAGLAVVPMAASAFVVAGVGGRLLQRVPPWAAVSGGLLLIGVGLLAQTAISAGSSWTVLVPGLVLTGVGVGVAIPVLVSAALAAAPPERAGMASGAVNTFRQLGFALGVAVLGTIFGDRVAATGSLAAGLDRVYLLAGLAAVATSAAVAALARRPAGHGSVRHPSPQPARAAAP
ncbi:MFS transporter [Streptomyces millisiae]|uniref:MFS transporter n=1 Tax=Streptomyces millisiae TaxID=3075542 RepID=A0ABU2M214_9ACTN|nr:MFS transporter [Streptomyces sp. DSM 44918]MDT0323583.1 MFS transporter [Streptomyces sp. DSM 44918]